jgi:hypothetical protein
LLVVGCLLAVDKSAQAKAKRVNQGGQQQAAVLAQQWRSALQTELAFVRQICPDLPPPDRVRVKVAAEQALRAAAQNLSALQDLTDYEGPTPQSMIRDAVAEKLHEALPADQWEHFAAEAAARIKRRKTAAIGLVLAYIDDLLFLTPQQRDQISQALTDRWKPAWEGWLQLRFRFAVPALRNEMVVPYLNPDQKAAWENNLSKMALSVQFITGQMSDDDIPMDADWWNEAAADAKPVGEDVPPP